MYRPREFALDDPEVMRHHVVENPMGIIASSRGHLDATHLPFLLDGDNGDLISHYAIRNAQLSGLVDGDEVLVVFPGPHAYVSASMYRAEPDVPTWNYTAVHVRGRFIRTSDVELRALLARTVDTFEAGRPGAFSTREFPVDALEAMARAVAGFRVVETTWQGAFKLSQDKLAEDVRIVVDAFSSSNEPAERAVADQMTRHGVAGREGPPTTDPATWMPSPAGESTR